MKHKLPHINAFNFWVRMFSLSLEFESLYSTVVWKNKQRVKWPPLAICFVWPWNSYHAVVHAQNLLYMHYVLNHIHLCFYTTTPNYLCLFPLNLYRLVYILLVQSTDGTQTSCVGETKKRSADNHLATTRSLCMACINFILFIYFSGNVSSTQ